VAASGYCFVHDPTRDSERHDARQRGGQHSAKIIRLRPLVPDRLKPIYTVLESALSEVHAGDITPSQATAMAAIARALVQVLDHGELEERLRRLEEAR
jgi:hypothetical protein